MKSMTLTEDTLYVPAKYYANSRDALVLGTLDQFPEPVGLILPSEDSAKRLGGRAVMVPAGTVIRSRTEVATGIERFDLRIPAGKGLTLAPEGSKIARFDPTEGLPEPEATDPTAGLEQPKTANQRILARIKKPKGAGNGKY